MASWRANLAQTLSTQAKQLTKQKCYAQAKQLTRLTVFDGLNLTAWSKALALHRVRGLIPSWASIHGTARRFEWKCPALPLSTIINGEYSEIYYYQSINHYYYSVLLLYESHDAVTVYHAFILRKPQKYTTFWYMRSKGGSCTKQEAN